MNLQLIENESPRFRVEVLQTPSYCRLKCKTCGQMSIAISDIIAGFERIGLAATLAVEDLKDRYRRSYIGLAWIIVSFLVFIAIKGVIFTSIFDQPGYDFFSHLVIGFVIFGFISSTVSGGTQIYVVNRTWILSCNLPYTVYAHVLVIRSLAELVLVGFTAALIIVVFGDISPGHLWSLPPALVLYYLSALGICLFFGPFGARYRDVIYAVQTIMRIMFFATPVIWIPTPGTIRETIAYWNPLTYYIDIVRTPLIDGRLPLGSWAVSLAITAILLITGLIVFNKTKREIPLWL